MIRFDYGATRFVLLTSTTAYKFARIRLLRAVARLLFELPFSSKRRARFLKKYGPGWARAILHDVFIGILANRLEFSYWQESEDKRVMPTMCRYFGGLLVTQLNGPPAPENLCVVSGMQHLLPENLRELEITKSWQFRLHPQTQAVVLVDYGKESTVRALRRTYRAA